MLKVKSCPHQDVGFTYQHSNEKQWDLTLAQGVPPPLGAGVRLLQSAGVWEPVEHVCGRSLVFCLHQLNLATAGVWTHLDLVTDQVGGRAIYNGQNLGAVLQNELVALRKREETMY